MDLIKSSFQNRIGTVEEVSNLVLFLSSDKSTYINGTTIFPTKEIRKLGLSSNRHGLISEMATKLLHTQIKYCEIPATFRFPSRERKITIRNLFDVASSFIKLFIEIKITNRKNYIKNAAKKVNFNS